MKKLKEVLLTVRNNTSPRWLNMILFLLIPSVVSICVALFVSIIMFCCRTLSAIFGLSSYVVSTFGEDFVATFVPCFFVVSIIVLISLLITLIRNKRSRGLILCILIVVTALCLIGGNKILNVCKSQVEDRLQSQLYFGDAFYSQGAYSDAITNYKIGIFIDKYIVLWNENNEIPKCYDGIAQSYMQSEELEEADRYFDKAIDAYEKYMPSEKHKIAISHLRAAMVTSALDDNSQTLFHANEASDFYEENLETSDAHTAASAFIWLANAYYNDAQYEKACEFFELGIPLFYDSVNWGVGDEADAKMIAISYKIASLAYLESGSQEQYEAYNALYEDFVWFRDFSDADLDHYIDYFHWMNR